MQGKTYMNFNVKWSNSAGNCTLIVCTDYEDTESRIKNFFLHCALGLRRAPEAGYKAPVCADLLVC